MTGTPTDKREATLLAHAGRAPEAHQGFVNVPPSRASTILFPTLDALETPDRNLRAVRYARTGTPGSHAFEDAVAALEGGYRAVATPSGLSAMTTALMAFARAGDHVLMTDSAYEPTRTFCDTVLAGFGVAVEYYDPAIGADIAGLMRDTTRIVFLESPGSQTFEVQDVPAIARAAKERSGGRCTVMIDNTWSAGVVFKPLAHGVDVSLQAATKYIVGHADANLGVCICTEATWRQVKDTAIRLGIAAGSEDLYLGLRGLRTLSVRLPRHGQTGLILADWLARQPEVTRVLHPARPGCPGHDLWRRDFTGTTGLFAVELAPVPRRALAALVDGLELFGMGYSWGGFESLVLPVDPRRARTAVPWRSDGRLLRFHAGLEDPDDLIRDLEAGFDRLRKALTP